MFEETRELWTQYDHVFAADPTVAQFHLSGEVADRLEQLDRILSHLGEAMASLAAATEVSRDDMDEAMHEIWLFAETFYFFAWRLREIVTRAGSDALPRMKGVDFKGINLVRNQLIEHPEKKGRRFARRFVLGAEGPVLKPLPGVIGEDGFVVVAPGDDPGLLVNARELRDRLTQHLQKILDPRDLTVEGAWQSRAGELRISPATVGDADEIFALLTHPDPTYVHHPPPHARAIRDEFPRPPEAPWWTVRRMESGTLVGLLEVRLFPEPKLRGEKPRVAELTLHIHPDDQGRGLGAIVLGTCIALLHRRGWTVEARIHHTNANSERLAKKVGLLETRRFDDVGHAFWSAAPPISPSPQ